VRVRYGPATVNGYEIHKVPLGNREGVEIRLSRESGDLSEVEISPSFRGRRMVKFLAKRGEFL